MFRWRPQKFADSGELIKADKPGCHEKSWKRGIQEKGTHLYQSNKILLSKKEDRTRSFQMHVYIKTPIERQQARWWSRT